MISKLEKIVTFLLEYFIISIYIVMIALGFSQVVFRYVLRDSIFWSEEFLTYVFIWLVFMGAALAVKSNSHPSVDVFINLIARKKGKITHYHQIIMFSGMLLYAVIATIYGFDLYTKAMSFSSALMIPYKYVYLALPVGSVLIGFYAIIHLLSTINKIKETAN